jgi:hypothetical protein
MVVQFRKTIGTPAESYVNGLLSGFSCLDSDVESFLKTKAYQHEQRNRSRTYLVVSDDATTLEAYFTLSLKALEFDEGVSKSTIKSIDGFNKNASSTPVILIGQFGKDIRNGQKLKGAELLDICMRYVYEIHYLVGSRIVLVESANNEKALAFYRDNGFSVFREDQDDKLIQMIRSL